MANLTGFQVLAATARFTLNGQEDLTTFHYLVDFGAGPPEELFAAYNAFNTQEDVVGGLMGVYAACISSDVDNIQWYTQFVSPIRYISQVYTPEVYSGGQVEAFSLPQNVSVGVSVRGDLAVPDNRGTKHMGGVPTTFVESGMVVEPGISAYQELIEYYCLPNELIMPENNYTMLPILWAKSPPEDNVRVTNGFVGQASRVSRRRTVGLGS